MPSIRRNRKDQTCGGNHGVCLWAHSDWMYEWKAYACPYHKAIAEISRLNQRIREVYAPRVERLEHQRDLYQSMLVHLGDFHTPLWILKGESFTAGKIYTTQEAVGEIFRNPSLIVSVEKIDASNESAPDGPPPPPQESNDSEGIPAAKRLK